MQPLPTSVARCAPHSRHAEPMASRDRDAETERLRNSVSCTDCFNAMAFCMCEAGRPAQGQGRRLLPPQATWRSPSL